MPDKRFRLPLTMDGSATSAAAVSPDGCWRMRSNAAGTAIEVSYDGAAYTTLSGGGGAPAGSGSEIQYRVDASTFGAVTGSTVSGDSIGLNGNLTIAHTTTSTAVDQILEVQHTQSNATYASSTNWYGGARIITYGNTTANSGNLASLYAVLEYDAAPGSTHRGAAIVAGLAFGSSLTVGSGKPLHGLLVDDILGSYTSIHTYYGVKVLAPTGTVTNSYGIAVEALKNGFGTLTPTEAIHVHGGNILAEQDTFAVVTLKAHGTGVSPRLTSVRSRGTAAAPTELSDADVLSQFLFYGYGDNTHADVPQSLSTANLGAIMQVDAEGAWTGNAGGSTFRFRTRGSVGTSPTNTFLITGTQRIGVGANIAVADVTHSLTVIGDAKFTLGSDATGDMWYRAATTGTFTRLGTAGASSGYVLTLAGSPLLPTWAATGAGGNPGGSGSEIQYRAGASTFGAVTGSSVSGDSIALNGNLTIAHTTTSTSVDAILDVAHTQSNATFASSTNWYGGGRIVTYANTTGSSGNIASLYAVLEYDATPGSTHKGAAIVAGLAFGSSLTIASGKPLHGLYVPDILGSYTSINTYYGVRIIEPTGTVTNKYGVVAEGAQLSGFGVTPTATLHASGTVRFDLGSDAAGDMLYRNTSSTNLTRLATSGRTAGDFLTLAGGTLIPTWATTLPLANGGTGAALTDPNADRILFWDDSGGAVTWLTASTGLAITTTSLTLSHLGIQSLTDPNADRIMFWDDSAGATDWLTAGTGLSISGTTLTASGNTPGGSGSEIQYRSGASTFGAVTGSSVSGDSISINGNVTVAHTVTSTSVDAILDIASTQSNATFASSTNWYGGARLITYSNTTGGSGKMTAAYALLEYDATPGASITGAGLVAGIAFGSSLTIASGKPLHGIYVDDILGSPTSVHTYYGIRVKEPTVTVTNKYGIAIEGAQNSGFGVTTPAYPIDVSRDSSATAVVSTIANYEWSSSGTPAAGFGLSERYGLESSTTASQLAAQMDVRWQVATHASRGAVYTVKTVANAIANERVVLGGYKVLTDNTQTDLFSIVFGTGDHTAVGGFVEFVFIARQTTGGNQIQSYTKVLPFNAYHNAATNTGAATWGTEALTAALSSTGGIAFTGGSLGFRINGSLTMPQTGFNTATFQVQVDSDLATLLDLVCYYNIVYTGQADITLA